MNVHRTRRDFLSDVGRGVLTVAVGADLAHELKLTSPALAAEPSDELDFGAMEPLVRVMQETPPDQLLPAIVTKLRNGVDLRQLTAAAALANARTFGGEDYVGYHTLMALSPAFHMAEELQTELKPLPILKVLLRNSTRIHEKGGRKAEVLKVVRPDGEKHSAKEIRDFVRKEKMDAPNLVLRPWRKDRLRRRSMFFSNQCTMTPRFIASYCHIAPGIYWTLLEKNTRIPYCGSLSVIA